MEGSSSGTASFASGSVLSPVKEEEILKMLQDDDISEKERALVIFEECAGGSNRLIIDSAVRRIFDVVVSMLQHNQSPNFIRKAASFIDVLSHESPNRIKIAQSGAILSLVNLLSGRDIATINVARAVLNLSLDESCKESMSSGFVISCLLDCFCNHAGNGLERQYAGWALSNQSFNSSNNARRLVETAGSVKQLLELAMDRTNREAENLSWYAQKVICSLALISEGRKSLIDARAVYEMVRMTKEGTWDEAFCFDVLYQIHTCKDNGDLFKGIAISTGAEEVLSQDREDWGQRKRDMARIMLDVVRQDTNMKSKLGCHEAMDGSSSGTASNASGFVLSPVKEEEILKMLQDDDSSKKERALVIFEECSGQSNQWIIDSTVRRIFESVISMLQHNQSTNFIRKAASFIDVLSDESSNRIKIAQSGAILSLVNLLSGRDVATINPTINVARAVLNLSLDESCKESMSNGFVISWLLEHFCDHAGNSLVRQYAGWALSNLSFNSSNNVRRLVETAGTVNRLLELVTDRTNHEAKNMSWYAQKVICSLALITEGRKALIDAGAVYEMVRMTKEGAWDEASCIDVLYQIQTCKDNGHLFKWLAISAGAEEVLSHDKEEWGEAKKDMARKMLDVVRQEDHFSEEVIDAILVYAVLPSNHNFWQDNNFPYNVSS